MNYDASVSVGSYLKNQRAPSPEIIAKVKLNII